LKRVILEQYGRSPGEWFERIYTKVYLGLLN
jgi:hypothetical protein